MSKTIFVLLDGCSDAAAVKHFGYLEHLAEIGDIARYTVQGELPSSSRPIYETLLTGLPASRHGITSNLVCRNSDHPNIFSLCRDNQYITAAAAYYWVSELYNTAPFHQANHRIQLNESGTIQNGIFYFEDTYPDSHVLCDAEYLRNTCQPDFLMIHTMNLDDVGHKFGEGSREQAKCAMFLDTGLAALLPLWMREGYNILITADHGMNENGVHGGNQPCMRQVPLYIYSDKIKPVISTEPLSQLAVAPLLCRMLGIEKSEGMMALHESGVELIEAH